MNQSTRDARITRRAPLSKSQRRMWAVYQTESDSAAYNTSLVLELGGALNVELFCESVRQIQRRHEALRTGFTLDYETAELLQLVYEDEVEVEVIEATASGVPLIVSQECALAFDLERSSCRFKLLRVAEKSHVFVAVFHHIIWDAWSRQLFMEELAQRYNSAIRGEAAVYESLLLQPCDFAIEETAESGGERRASSLAYWNGALSNIPNEEIVGRKSEELPMTSRIGASLLIELSDEFDTRLTLVKRRARCSNTAVFLAAIALAAKEYYAASDVIIGVAAYNRPTESHRRVIGCFINMMPIRVSLQGEVDPDGALAIARAALLDAFEHQDAPYEEILETSGFREKRRLGHPFQIACRELDVREPIVLADGCVVKTLSRPFYFSRFDLLVEFGIRDGRFIVLLNYDVEALDDSAVRLFGERLKGTLDDLVGDLGDSGEGVTKKTSGSDRGLSVNTPLDNDDIANERVEGSVASCVEILLEVWSKVLKREIGAHVNVFSAGADSIKVIAARALALKRGVDVPIAAMYAHPTIAAVAPFASHVAKKNATSEIEPFRLLTESDRNALHAQVADAYPMSRLQVGMIYEALLDPETYAYNLVDRWSCRGSLDLIALSDALDATSRQIPVLRTAFDVSSFGEPLQLVYDVARANVTIHTLTEADDVEARVREIVLAASERQIEFSQAPLISYDVVVAQARWELIVSTHHALLDGRSLDLLFERIMAHYAIATGANALPPRDLETSNAVFILLERQVMESDVARRYWQESMYGVKPGSCRIPETRVVQRSLKEQVSFEVPQQVAEQLSALASDAGVQLKSVLMATYLACLAAECGVDDVVTGVTVHGRPETPDGDVMLGMFLNTVPFRLNMRGYTWRALVREVERKEAEMLPHRRYPMSELKQWYGAELYHSLFNYVHEAVLPADMAGGIHPKNRRHIKLNIDFNVVFVVGAQHSDLTLGIAFREESYSPEMVRAFAHRLLYFLSAAASYPDAVAWTFIEGAFA